MLKEIHEQPEAMRETIGERLQGGRVTARASAGPTTSCCRRRAGHDRRLRHRLPRGARRPLPARGVGPGAGRDRRGLRVPLPQPGARRAHARDRGVAVGRDRRHDRRAARRPPGGARILAVCQRDGKPAHARGRRDAVHALRPRDRRRRDEDVHRRRWSRSRCWHCGWPSCGARSPPVRLAELRGEIAALPDLARDVPRRGRPALGLRPRRSPGRVYEKEFFLYIGRHLGMPVCLEGALKLKEISYVADRRLPAGEMKHGPIALLDEDTPVVAVMTDSPRVRQGRLERAGGARPRRQGDRASRPRAARRPRSTPTGCSRSRGSSPELAPALAILPLQVLAYRSPACAGCRSTSRATSPRPSPSSSARLRPRASR